MNEPKKKTAVITGAASGLGRAMSLVLAEQGWEIGLVDLDEVGARKTLELVQKKGGRGKVYPLDVSSEKDMARMAAHFFESWDRIDLLVNNAGVAVAGIVGDISPENWQWQLQNNLWSVIYGCHCFIPWMKRQGGGRIINIASGAGIVSFPEMAPYNVTKAGVISLSETLHAELAPEGIGVTVVCPLFFKTNLIDTFRFTHEFQKEFFEANFAGARITAERVARLALQAAAKGKLYCFPQLSSKIFWLFKRLFSGLLRRMLASIYRRGGGKPLLRWMARRGRF